MKQIIWLIVCVFAWPACSTTNRIQKVDSAAVNGMILEQRAAVFHIHGLNDQTYPAGVKITYRYLDVENKAIRPQVTVNFQFKDIPDIEIPDSVLSINLDNENIPLFSAEKNDQNNHLLSSNGKLNGKVYIIPENLWIPIVHSQKVVYLFINKKAAIEVRFKESEHKKLIEFLELAIKQNTEKFPAVPEGQVKW